MVFCTPFAFQLQIFLGCINIINVSITISAVILDTKDLLGPGIELRKDYDILQFDVQNIILMNLI